MASLLGAPCGLVDPGAQAAAAATVAVFSVDASGGTLIMPPEGCVTGAVAGSSRSLSSWSVVDAGATAVVPVMSVAAAAKHEFVSDLLLVIGSAAVFAGSGSSRVPGCFHVPLLLVSWFLELLGN